MWWALGFYLKGLIYRISQNNLVVIKSPPIAAAAAELFVEFKVCSAAGYVYLFGTTEITASTGAIKTGKSSLLYEFQDSKPLLYKER